ncbi:SurA N-terminal domain-containing protein [Rhodobacteraceae bacterium 2376]|uniref:SurA N-terminal domain-containing protein n=1 Tax=Rhabdonatronobacter sediminivivens TaxID=2743469 RepID=A0A7Z0HWA2_9RHOB|nr:SurA N-terminal domain-containing protein [Rhabdonatronobacter sediminivivens]NYS23546.1 SurA N-terminal domain-containing protein [Rhabdonatronobacter sediminivivens]
MAKKTSTATKIGGGFLLLLLIVAMAGFGVEGFGTSVRSIGSVGDRDISTDEYARALQEEMRALSQQTGQAATMQQMQMMGVDQSVMRQLVMRATLDNEADTLGVSVSDSIVQQEILAISAFQGLDGNFDRESYRFALQSAGLSETQFEEQLRADAARGLLQTAVVAGVTAPAAQAELLLEFAGEQRDFTVVTLGRFDLDAPLPTASDAILRQFHQDNIDQFTLPEGKRLSYALVTPSMLLETLDVEDEALREEYERRAGEFRRPERRLVERLVYRDEATASEAMARMEQGEATFETLVAERGLDLEDTDMGDVTQDQLGAAGAEVFALDGPGTTGPHPTTLGPALFRVNAVLPAQETPFEAVRDDLRAELGADMAARILAQQLDDYEDLLAGGADVADLVAETEMEGGEIDWREGERDGVAAYAEFREAARAAEPGDFPEILLLDNGGLLSVELVEPLPAMPQAFEDVREEVLRAWEETEIEARLLRQAEAVREGMMQGEPLDALSGTQVSFEGLTRTDFLPDLPRDLVTMAFDLGPGETAVMAEGAQVHVIMLDDTRGPDRMNPDVQRLGMVIQQQLEQGVAQDVFAYFTTALQSEVSIQLNQSVIEAVHAQFQ